MKPEDPWSTASALAFFAWGYVGYELVQTPEAAVFFGAMTALWIGTTWRHYSPSELSRTADQGTMHLPLAAMVLLALGAHWTLMAVGAVAAGWFLERRYDLQLRPIMSVYGALLIAALLPRGEYLALAGFVVLVGGGVLIRDRWPTDAHHALWHGLSAPGLLAAFLGLV